MQVRRPPTIRDVAAVAGVSTAAVSKFVNGQQRFSAEVETRIRDAVSSLGYRQNPLARGMVTGETRTVGFAVLDFSNPYFTSLARGAHRAAAAAGYTLIVVDTQRPDTSEPDPRLFEALTWRVDGLLVSARLPTDSIEWLATRGKPVVVFGRSPTSGVPSVGADPIRTGYIMGRHLLDTGRRRVAYVGDPVARWNSDRLRGLREALAEGGLEPVVFEARAATLEGGAEVGAAVFDSTPRFDAVVGANDLTALGLMNAARSLGVRVPEDTAIAGFDDVTFARYAHPPLTTVDTRSEDVGAAAMSRLLALLRGETVEGAEYIEPRLIARASTERGGN